jgi:hypothetical protein
MADVSDGTVTPRALDCLLPLFVRPGHIRLRTRTDTMMAQRCVARELAFTSFNSAQAAQLMSGRTEQFYSGRVAALSSAASIASMSSGVIGRLSLNGQLTAAMYAARGT